LDQREAGTAEGNLKMEAEGRVSRGEKNILSFLE